MEVPHPAHHPGTVGLHRQAVECRDRADPAVSRQRGLPELPDTDPDRRDHPETCDDDAFFHEHIQWRPCCTAKLEEASTIRYPAPFSIFAHVSRSPTVRLNTSRAGAESRKSTRLNSSHVAISYAVFCLK